MEKNFIEKSNNPEGFNIYIPSREDLEKKDFKFLHEKLTENHKKILPKIIEGGYPFFALHGTNSENIKPLLQSKSINRLELATFYQKEKNEFFLYKLYDMARYVTSYAKMNRKDRSKIDSMGSILVFDVEKDGKNLTHEWEHLLPGSNISTKLENDSLTEKKYRESLDNKNNLLYRTDHYFDIQKELFNQSLKIIELEKFQQLVERFKRGSQDMGYKILQERFRDQEIVSQILKIFKKE